MVAKVEEKSPTEILVYYTCLPKRKWNGSFIIQIYLQADELMKDCHFYALISLTCQKRVTLLEMNKKVEASDGIWKIVFSQFKHKQLRSLRVSFNNAHTHKLHTQRKTINSKMNTEKSNLDI